MNYDFIPPLIGELELPKVTKAYLCGKGPSLLEHVWKDDITLRVAINDASKLVPECTHQISTDAKAWDWTHEYIRAKGITLIAGEKIFKQRDVKNHPNIFGYYMKGEPTNDPNELWVGGGTGTTAVVLLCRRGIKEIHCVGFDAAHGVGECAPGTKRAREDNLPNYENTWRLMNKRAEVFGAKLIQHQLPALVP